MRILYVAAGIRVPGSFGGAIHTTEVAQGLAALGVDMHVVIRPPDGVRHAPWRLVSRQEGGITWHSLDVPKAVGLLAYPLISRLVSRIQPDAVMERYYNLAGAGILAAHRHRLPALLEVNALIVDPPQVRKRNIDDWLGRLLPGGTSGPFRRWAAWQCNHSQRIVTPLHTTVPPEVGRERIVELPWGANVAAFQPRPTPAGPPVVAFLGSFRHWHGVTDFVRAACRLCETGFDGRFLLIGDGPERQAAHALAHPFAERFTWTGAVPHAQVPALLATATIGVAPFNPARHPALLEAGFFWSPLKIYEYMAAGLPVVTADIPPLDSVIRPGQEGALFKPGQIDDLAQAIRQTIEHPDREAMGARARARVEAQYSWAAHCRDLRNILNAMIEERQ